MVLDLPGMPAISVIDAFLRFVIEPNLFNRSLFRLGPIPLIESILEAV